MALSFATIAATLGPVIKPLIEKGAKMIAKRLFVKVKGRFTGEESEIERDLIRAIEEKNVELFIKKYEQDLSVDIVQKIRALGNLKDLFDKVGRILQYKQYNEDSASVFMDLARALENVLTGVSFAEAGIQEIVVQDPETKERVSVTSEAYMVAILLRFAAAVWTQLAAKSTPSMKGWALEYDASMNIVVARPQILDEMQMEKKAEVAASRAMAPMPPPTPLMGAAASLDVLKFRSDYKNLMQLYRDSLPIRENYLKAASCLKTAQSKVVASKDRQRKTHKYMNPSHLEALVLGFRAEAQYWQFNMSEDLPQLAETVSKFFEADPERTERYLLESMEVSKTGLNEFMDVLTLYENVGDGLAGALKLYRDALDKCVGGKDEKMIKRRIDETKKSASKNPTVLVADPKPTL